MVDYLIASIPVAVGLFIYFVRLEARLAKISNDLCWIKKEMVRCQQS